jgi:acetyl-CoA carboxylase biotin carboxyl carrier protein
MSAHLELLVDVREGRRVLLAPSVGYFIAAANSGAPAAPGDLLGLLCILGREHELRLPAAVGMCSCTPRVSEARRAAVGFGDVLFELRELAAEAPADTKAPSDRAGGAGEGIAVPASQTGRYYDRPAPDRPPFVRVGDELHAGQPIGLIEVMKTFNQIVYGGPGFPARARVVALRCSNESEVRRGQELLRVEPLA